jgi:hypothetical protein
MQIGVSKDLFAAYFSISGNYFISYWEVEYYKNASWMWSPDLNLLS